MGGYRFGSCHLDVEARELFVDGARVPLEPQVFDVLTYLVTHRDRLVPKAELLDALWDTRFVTDSALTSRIKSARAAIGDDGDAQRLIRTQRGRGYRFVGDVDVLDDAEPGPAPETRRRASGSLPASRFRLVGRLDDLAVLDRLLRDHRIVTISGPGGAGKSTLAVEAARARAGEPGLEVAFVELAPARGRVGVTRAVAEATGVEGAAAGDPAMLTASLARRRLLLVLDNCEHLLDDVAELVDRSLDAGSGVTVLATSREPLGVDGERVHALGSLGRDAPTLFAERAAATGHGAVDALDPAVVELCERLDGLPLAIELAAAQTRHLSVAELVGRTGDRLDILVGGRSRAGVRHATLARTIEWSYDLLSDASRTAFDALGVFPASFDLAAVRAVCGLDPVAATNVVGDLVGKSLVDHDRDTGRYRLLETIRLFASQRLEASGRSAECLERLRRHAVERATAHPRHRVWLSASVAGRSRDDIENVRAAFDAGVAAGRFTDAVDLMLGLSTLWRNAVSYAEGLRWVDVLTPRPLAPRDRVWLHLVAADLGLGSGDPALMARAAAAATAELGAGVDDPGAAVIAGIYRALAAVSRPGEAVAGLAAAGERARDIGEPGLERLARAFRVVALLAGGRRDVAAELADLTSAPSDGYDRYIAIWAAWTDAFVRRDGPALRAWMSRQVENVRGSGLQENWVLMFCDALADIAGGADHPPRLSEALRRAEAEGRNADVDVVLALAYVEACRDRPVVAAELMGACGGRLFHDTANFLHFMIMRDCVVRPMLDAATFEAATARGGARSVASVLAEYRLGPG